MIAVAAKGGNRQPQSPDGFHIRAASFQPVRAAHAPGSSARAPQHRARRQAGLRGARSLLARELVRLGFAVAALDPDRDAARLGRETGARQRLAVDYEVGDAGRLPYADGSFDVGYWADTLEIAPQLDVVLAEAARGPSVRAASSSTTP